MSVNNINIICWTFIKVRLVNQKGREDGPVLVRVEVVLRVSIVVHRT